MHNLLLLLYTLEPAGAEKVVLSIADRIDRRRYSPVVCAFRGGRLRGAFERLGIPVYVLDKRPGFDPTTVWRLVRLMKRHRVGIVHSHNFSANLWGRVAACIAGVPVRIATEHSMPSIKSRLQRGIDRALAKVTTRIVSVSSAVRDAHIAHEQLDPDKCAVIYNGIERWDWSDTARREFDGDFRRRCGIPADAPLCIVVGRLEPPKGHDTLLLAVPSILKRVPHARFLLVGDGSLQATLEAQADRLGIRDAIVMLGARNDVRQLLSISDVAINPSHREGFSIAVLEAMAAGLPVVATDVGGNAEAVVSGESGIVVPPREPERLAEAVCAILDDGTYAARLGAMASRRFNEHFTLDQMIGSHELLYGGSVAERS